MKRVQALILALAVVGLTVIGCAALRQQRAGRTFRDCDECPLMVVIPAGSFLMGDSVYGHPQHKVTIGSPFAVAKDMVTRDEYRQCIAERGCSADKSLRNPSFPQTGSHPVINVNWEDAQAYVKWLSVKAGHHYRLLSESEYEYAERAGTSTAFWWGHEAWRACS